jgi:hypothetical protein
VRRGRLIGGAVSAAVLLLAVVQLTALIRYEPEPFVAKGMPGVPVMLAQEADEVVRPRTMDPYKGYGTWVDIYDFAPAFQSGKEPPVTPAAIDQMAASGVRTIYLQAAQVDARSPGSLVNPGVLATWLVAAHRAGLNVVAWYLPRFDDIDKDFAHLRAIADFQVLGHRFDGVGVDIEWTESVPDHTARSAQLIELSRRLRAHVGAEPLGAIVLPPVQTEVINPAKWPGFPYKELASSYDVWLPMAYWTERSAASGYLDGYRYTEESVRRLRTNVGDPELPVHAIGGLGAKMDAAQADGFVRAIKDTGSIGGSIYDWATLSPALNTQISAGLAK